VETHYGLLKALKGISLEIFEGEIVTLLGGNGAGKTTTLKTISGLIKPSSGEIRFLDTRIDGMPPHEIVRMGIAHVPEGRNIFPDMTVLENLKIGAIIAKGKNEVRIRLEQILTYFPILEERKAQLAGTLSGGEQQMLAIGRGMMSGPKLLMMDEPSLGLSPILVKKLAQIVKEIHSRGVTIFLVEQNATMALHIADRGYVLETGSVVIQGRALDLLSNEQVKKAYLGK
jgi:branched-chain amino acid transport system ATP-binding protein